MNLYLEVSEDRERVPVFVVFSAVPAAAGAFVYFRHLFRRLCVRRGRSRASRSSFG